MTMKKNIKIDYAYFLAKANDLRKIFNVFNLCLVH
jgi:hypothetical protein